MATQSTINSKLYRLVKSHVTKFRTLTFNTIPHSLHSLDVEEGSALVGRAHTQMLAHREKRPEAVSYSGSGLFCVLQHPPPPRTTRIQPLLVDSIVNRVKWKEPGVWGRYTELYFV